MVKWEKCQNSGNKSEIQGNMGDTFMYNVNARNKASGFNFEQRQSRFT